MIGRTAKAALAVLLALAAAACEPTSARTPPTGGPSGGPIPYGAAELLARPIGLHRTDASVRTVGRLAHLGSWILTARGTSRLGGVSGLVVVPNDRLGGPDHVTAVTDAGDLVRFDWPRSGGAPSAVPLTIAPLRDEAGAPLPGEKARADAEDATLAGIDERTGAYRLLVSFEREHRVLSYDGRAPGAATRPPLTGLPAFKANDGIEGLAGYATRDGRRLAVGAQDGRIWTCPELGGACALRVARSPFGFDVAGLAPLPGTGDLLVLYREFDLFRGWRTIVARLYAEGRIEALARIESPLETANYEGVAATPAEGPRGGWRVYLISDDGFDARERTLFSVFEYRE